MTENWNHGNSRRARGKILCFLLQCQAFPLQLQALSMNETKHLHHSWHTEAIQFFFEFIMNSNIVISFHHTMSMKRIWKIIKLKGSWNVRYVTWDNVFSGASRSTTQRQDSVIGRGGWSLYIHQADNKKMYVHWILLHL